jgi:excisionase family DNA binding protein
MQVLKKILTRPQAAKILGVHVGTVDRLIKTGKLPKVRLSYRRIGLLSADLNNYIEQQRGFVTNAPIDAAVTA